jgi:mannose/fructose/N-acetylgalactosamine-specific phosphotransferase system component IIC
MPDLLLVALLAGVLAVDDRAGWQSLLGEPVFAAWVVGAVLGSPEPALKCGVVLQLAWFSVGAARGTRRPNVVVGGMVGAGAVGLVLARTGDPRESVVIAAGVWVGLLAGEAGSVLARAADGLRERWLGSFRLPAVPPASYAAASRRLALTVVASTLFVGAVDFVATLALLPVATAVAGSMAARLGAGVASGATWWLVGVSAIGVATIARAFGTRSLARYLVLGAAGVLVAGWLS